MEDFSNTDLVLKERRYAKRRNVIADIVLHIGKQPHAYKLWCQTSNIGIGGAYIESSLLNKSEETDVILDFSKDMSADVGNPSIHADIIRFTGHGVVLRFKDVATVHKRYLSKLVR